MADISFYKYLEAAFRYRLFNPAGQRANLQTKFNALGYNLPYERIFHYARRVLPKFYTDTSRFPDTEEGNLQMAKKVLEKLDKHQDIELENQLKAVTVSKENAQIMAEAQAQSQQTEAQQVPPAGTSAGTSFGLPGLPSAPSISSGPRRIYNIPHAPDKPFQGPGQGTAATAKANRLTAQTTTGNLTPSTVSGSSSPPPPRFNWRSFKMPASFTNAAKNFGSTAQRFIGTNLGRIGRSLADIAGGVGRGIAGPSLTGTYNLLGKAANGGLNAFEGITRPGGIGGGGIGKGLSKSSNKFALGLIGIMLFFVLFGSMLGGLAGTTPTGQASPIGSGCPDTSTNRNDASCHYLNPSIDIFNITIPQSVINSYIVKNSPIFINAGKGDLTEFTKRTNYIVTNSQQAGLNPAIFLGYWKSESNFSTAGSRDLGCAGDNFYEQVDCALGINTFSDPVKNPIASCVRSRDANSSACISLKSVRQAFDKTHPIKYPVATFDDFAEAYGPYDHLSKESLHTNCTHTYNDLIDVAKELNSCIASSAIVPPPANGDLKQSIADKFGVDFQGPEFTADRLQAAWEVLNQAQQVAPRLFGLLGKGITATTHSDTSERVGNTIYFSTRPGSFFMTGSPQQFKVLLIHELGHVIRGEPGSTKANSYDQRLQSAVNQDALKNGDAGYLTGYGKSPCYGTPNIDEDFAETVTYYINKGAKEEDLGCGIKSANGLNPLESGLYPAHLTFIKSVLGEP